jgi:DNA repair exonuclease SbcCD ATPase subunit
MKRASVASFFLCFFLGVTALVGQEDDPSEIFLKAYLSAQQGEKLEHENRFKTALAKYRFAGSLIAQLRRSHPAWQPAIVEYRGRKISEGILRIQERTTRQNALMASSSPLPEVAPALPESDGWSEPGPEVVASQSDESSIQKSRDASATEATKKLRNNVDQLQAALEKSRSDLQNARKEKENISARLQETNSKLEKSQSELDKARESEFADINEQIAQLKEQLSETQKRNDYLVARAAELTVQLDEADTELQVAKLAGANSQESEQLTRENELLRNIVARERQEEARRDETRKLVVAELIS